MTTTPAPKKTAPAGYTTVKVTKAGDNKIATGELGEDGALNEWHPRGAMIDIPTEYVDLYEKRGWVEAD